ncbi:hypothetical protein D7X48_18095 [bacterium D16-50]|nr:hypothetical protein D7X48_18095 [bacterium D16-50]
MKIEISGSRCVSCEMYTQYYQNPFGIGYEAVDCGYCGRRSRNVRPGNRCEKYHERSNVGTALPLRIRFVARQTKKERGS